MYKSSFLFLDSRVCNENVIIRKKEVMPVSIFTVVLMRQNSGAFMWEFFVVTEHSASKLSALPSALDISIYFGYLGLNC